MHSLRFRFFAFIAALLLVLLLLLNTYPLISSRDAVYEEKRSSLASAASVVASSLAGLDRLNPESVAEVLTFLDISGYSRILVADRQGSVVYDDSGEPGGQTEIADVLTALGESKTIFRSRLRDGAFSSSYAMPMSSQGAVTGAVYLCEHDSEPAEIIYGIQNRIRVLSVFIGMAALLLAGVFVLALMQRLRDLAQSMRVVAEGDYSYRHPIRGQDEISELGEEFNLLTERLETTEKQRRRFVSDASHELKTPLASIRLLSDSIVQNEGMDPATVREFAADIGHEAQRLQRTTEDLLDLSRMDDGIGFVPEPTDVSRAAEDALAMLRPLAQERAVRLSAQLEDGCVVMGSPDEIFKIIFNLTENAIKYNVPEGSVALTVRGDGEIVEIEVADTGIGIPEEDRLNIFDRFYRVDKARSRASGGNGLGLSIVHDAVQAHGGSIAVGQNKPQGSLFIVALPRATEEETGI